MTLLTRAEILAALDVVIEVLPAPEWGGDVRVRSLSGEERETMDVTIYEGHKAGRRVSIMAVLAALSIVDDAGERVFTDQDVAALAKKASAPLDRVYDFHRKHSGIGGATVETLAKNSETGLSGGNGSGSPSASAG